MKKIIYEVKIEKSVKFILCALTISLFLNVFSAPISKELFGITESHAVGAGAPVRAWIQNWPSKLTD